MLNSGGLGAAVPDGFLYIANTTVMTNDKSCVTTRLSAGVQQTVHGRKIDCSFISGISETAY